MTDTNEPLPGFGEIPESAQDWAKQDAAQIAAAQQGRYKDTNEPPAQRRARNAALAKLLGYTAQKRCGINKDYWVLLDPQGKVCATSSAGEDAVFRTKGKPFPSGVPDCCGNGADCFELLAELNARKIRVEILTIAVTVWLTCKNSPYYHCAVVDIDNSLPDKREALREALTAAAWQALTAQKEKEI